MKWLVLIPVMFFSACLYFDPDELDGNPPLGYLAATAISFAGLDASCSPEGGGLRYYVNAAAAGGDGLTWLGAINNLQTAINIAPTGAEIWVAQGIYRTGTTGQTTSTFNLKNNVSIYGGFPAGAVKRCQRDWRIYRTVLSGDLDGDDTDLNGDGVITSTGDLVGTNSGNVVTVTDGIDRTARLDGFVITAGNGSSNDGAGITILNGSPTLVNLLVIANHTTGVGGGMYNRADGAGKTSSPLIANSAFIANEVSGAGLDGGGIYNHSLNSSTAAPIVINTIFQGNIAADEGGGIFDQACTGSGTTAAVYLNVTVAGNSAGNGGGINFFLCGGGTANNSRMLNSIVYNNTATSGPDVTINTATNIRIQNSIILGNLAAINLVSSGSFMDDGGNSGSDPLLSNAGNFDGLDDIIGTTDDGLRIQAGSAAIDAGTAADVADLDGDANVTETIPDIADLDGDGDTTDIMPLDFLRGNRFLGGTIDIGAYELQ